MNRSPINGWWYPHIGDGISGVYQGVGNAIIGSPDYQTEIPAFLVLLAGGDTMPIVYDVANFIFLDRFPEVGDPIRVDFTDFARLSNPDGHDLWRPVYEVSIL